MRRCIATIIIISVLAGSLALPSPVFAQQPSQQSGSGNNTGLIAAGAIVGTLAVGALALCTGFAASTLQIIGIGLSQSPGICAITNPPGLHLFSADGLRTYILNPLARMLVRVMVQATTQQVVSWIQNDSGRNVGYVGNLDKAFRREADIAGGEFLNQLTGINLCGNIGAFLQLSLRVPGIQQRLACTVTDIVANVNSFFRNFQNGGWPAFIRLSLEPQNNPYGAYLIALDAKIEAETNARRRLEIPLQKSYPFLGLRVPVAENCTVVPVEIAESHELREVQQTNKDIKVKPAEIFPEESEKEQIKKETTERRVCTTEYQTKTPGQLVEAGLNEAAFFGINFAGTAKEFDEAISTIISAFINRLISTTFSSQSFATSDSFARGGGFSYSQGIFDSSLSQITLSPQENAGAIIRQTNDPLFLADAIINQMEKELKTSFQTLFTLRRQITGTSTLDQKAIIDAGARIDTLLINKNAALGTKSSILDLQRTIASPNANPQSISDLAQQIPQLQFRLNSIAGSAGIGASPAFLTGNARSDALQLIQGNIDIINSTNEVVTVMVGEVTRVASSSTIAIGKRTSLERQQTALMAQAARLGQAKTFLEQNRRDINNTTNDVTIRQIAFELNTPLIGFNRLIQEIDDTIKVSDQILQQ